MMSRRLHVTLDFGEGASRAVGQLAWDASARHVVADWDPAFAANPLPLSPLRIRTCLGLLRPRGQGFGDLPGLYGDSLPDGWGRMLIDRRFTARGRARHEITDLDRLAMIGMDGMGALAYRPASDHHDIDPGSLDWFDRQVTDLSADLPVSLDSLQTIQGGSQGARPKFVARMNADGALRGHRGPHVPGFRDVLVKRRAMRDPVGAIEAEAAYASLAKAAGIVMSPSRVARTTDGEPFFITDRFDRPGRQRLHMQTVAALLDADFRSAVFDYADLMKLARFMTRDQRAVDDLFRRMVFNVRALNRDDHLKNHAFLMDAGGGWRLSPAYDLSFSPGPGGEHALLVAGEGRRPGLSHMLQVAASASIKPGKAKDIIAEVDAALQAWPVVSDAAKVPVGLSDTISDAITTARAW